MNSLVHLVHLVHLLALPVYDAPPSFVFRERKSGTCLVQSGTSLLDAVPTPPSEVEEKVTGPPILRACHIEDG